jgi:hypothetical protein
MIFWFLFGASAGVFLGTGIAFVLVAAGRKRQDLRFVFLNLACLLVIMGVDFSGFLKNNPWYHWLVGAALLNLLVAMGQLGHALINFLREIFGGQEII